MKLRYLALLVLLLIPFVFARELTPLDITSEDDVFKELKTNDDLFGESIFTMDTYKSTSMDKNLLTLEFDEIRGSVKSYKILAWQNCTTSTRTPTYKTQNMCYNITYNKLTDEPYDDVTEVVDEKNLEVRQDCADQNILTSYEIINTTEEDFCEYDSIPSGERDYKIADFDVKWGDWGYEFDWVPVINIDGTEYRQEKWAWFNTSWDYRANYTFTNNYGSALSNYPCNFTINASDLITNSKLNDTGADLRIIDPTNSESLSWINTTPLNTNATIWFRCNITASGTKVYSVYYGNNGVQTTATNQTDVRHFRNESDTGFLVWMTEGTGTSVDKVTGNAPSGTSGTVTWNTTGCMFDTCTYWTDDYWQYTDDGSYDVGNPGNFTIESWVYHWSIAGNNHIVSRRDSDVVANRIPYSWKSEGAHFYTNRRFTDGNYLNSKAENNFTAHRWYHTAITFNEYDDSVTWYLDGKMVKNISEARNAGDNNVPFMIGRFDDNQGGGDIEAYLNGVRLVKRAMTSNEINHSAMAYDITFAEGSEESQASNTAPEVTTPLITPSTAYTITNLTANTTYTDADDDNSTVTFTWYMNGTNILNESFFLVTNNTVINSTLGSGNFTKLALINVTVQANDGTDNSSIQNSTILTISNSAPVWTQTITSRSIFHNANLTIQFNATDADSDSLTWTDSTALFAINASGYVFDNPTISDVGNNSININVTDGASTISMNWTYEVKNRYPQFTELPLNQSLFHTQNLSLQLNATDADGDTINWTVNTTLVSISSGGLVTDNPAITEAGNYSITIQINDSLYTNTTTFNYEIKNRAPSQPTITNPSNNTYYNLDPGTNEVRVNVNYSSTDADGDNLTYYVFVNGALYRTTNTNSSFILPIRTDSYNITARATDGVRNSTDSLVTFVYIREVSSSGGGGGGGGAPADAKTGLITVDESIECEYWFDKKTYIVGDTITFGFSCPDLVGLKYILSWENAMGGVYQSEIGKVYTENQAIFVPEGEFNGNVHLHIPSVFDEYKEFRVYPRDYFLNFKLGTLELQMPNFGKIIAGDRTPPIVGWAILGVTIFVVWSALIAGPDIILNRFKTKKKKRVGK